MTASADILYDLAIIGGGINGAAIARDAAGRGFSVLLAEKDDFGAHTSSASSKLIHGGVRYLEQHQFGLVRESLRERAILLRAAPHLVRPLPFVMPDEPGIRPGRLIRAGLLLYDLLSLGGGLGRSESVDLAASPYGDGLTNRNRKGFVYRDCTGDDCRLVIENLQDAARLGASVHSRTEMVSARSAAGAWILELREQEKGETRTARARLLVNAAGPFAAAAAGRIEDAPPPPLRLIKGSHIVLPRLFSGNHAVVLQRPDGRIVFAIPYQGRFTLLGTTEVDNPADALGPHISEREESELLAAAATFSRSVTRADIVWCFSGTRPILSGLDEARQASREYKLLPGTTAAGAPHIAVIGGKLTTHRALAEKVTDLAAGMLRVDTRRWTARCPLPGKTGMPCAPEVFAAELARRHPGLPPEYIETLVFRYGGAAARMLEGAVSRPNAYPTFGDVLSVREVDWLIHHEWARTADDILWRRTKAGLLVTAKERAALEDYLSRRVGR